jgi:hypothetical protein
MFYIVISCEFLAEELREALRFLSVSLRINSTKRRRRAQDRQVEESGAAWVRRHFFQSIISPVP